MEEQLFLVDAKALSELVSGLAEVERRCLKLCEIASKLIDQAILHQPSSSGGNNHNGNSSNNGNNVIQPSRSKKLAQSGFSSRRISFNKIPLSTPSTFDRAKTPATPAPSYRPTPNGTKLPNTTNATESFPNTTTTTSIDQADQYANSEEYTISGSSKISQQQHNGHPRLLFSQTDARRLVQEKESRRKSGAFARMALPVAPTSVVPSTYSTYSTYSSSDQKQPARSRFNDPSPASSSSSSSASSIYSVSTFASDLKKRPEGNYI